MHPLFPRSHSVGSRALPEDTMHGTAWSWPWGSAEAKPWGICPPLPAPISPCSMYRPCHCGSHPHLAFPVPLASHPALCTTACPWHGQARQEGAEHQPGQAAMAVGAELLPLQRDLWSQPVCELPSTPSCTAPLAIVWRWHVCHLPHRYSPQPVSHGQEHHLHLWLRTRTQQTRHVSIPDPCKAQKESEEVT